MRVFYKLMARILILSIVWMPFSIQAEMIGTDQVAGTAQGQLNRDKVTSFLSRSEVAAQLEALGLSASKAKERVDAMTQQEVNRLAGRIDALPAGASDAWAWAAAIAIIAVFIWVTWYQK